INVLIDGAGRARLADFGISGIADSKIPAWTSQSSGASKGGTVAWQAPELFDPDNDENAKNTKESDVYAWGCVAYEIFTGDIPFAGVKDFRVISIVQSGKCPTRPSSDSKAWTDWGLTDDIWLLMEETWKRLPGNRPPCTKIVERLKILIPRDKRPKLKTGMLTPQAFRQRMNVSAKVLTVEELNIILNDGSDVDDNAADIEQQLASSIVDAYQQLKPESDLGVTVGQHEQLPPGEGSSIVAEGHQLADLAGAMTLTSSRGSPSQNGQQLPLVVPNGASSVAEAPYQQLEPDPGSSTVGILKQLPPVAVGLPSQVEETIAGCPRFCILVAGKSGIGKSSLVKRIFNIDPDKIDISHDRAGKADINHEYKSIVNPRLILHDSQGFEHGSDENLTKVEDFLTSRQKSDLPEKIHAIW
ncbi:hypothetical protein H0H92_010017, partial [Tricholoma furcatifolium]